MSPFCAAVDWGTSSFRLWLLDTDGRALAERRSSEGMLHCQDGGFAPVLERHLAEVGVPASLGAMICGMAGARQGWREARYLDTPAALDTLGDHAIRITESRRDVRILPGIAQRVAKAPDVMRGEETQLLGALDGAAGDHLVCMPGTHSKWVAVEAGRVASFCTFMTGELFAVLSRHSILAYAVPEGEGGDEAGAGPHFLEGVADGAEAPEAMTRRLFGLRASQLLGFSERNEGGAYLSGLLIGVEIAGAQARYGAGGPVTLIAGGRLAGLYEAALGARGHEVRHVDADGAVRGGLYRAARSAWSGQEAA